MATGLREQLDWHGGRGGSSVELRDVDQHHRRVAAGCGRHHVAGVLLVAGCIGDDELTLFGGEVTVSDIDRDALLALGLQAVGQQRQIDRSPCGTLLERVELVGQDRPRVV